MRWRVISTGVFDAFRNMALDEAISEAITNGSSEATIRFYEWKPSAVSIGYFQSLEREVNAEACKRYGVDVVRRRTGGGAVYHDTEGEITYSVIAKEAVFPKGIIESYREICGWIVEGLANLGISAHFHPINDIIVNGKKISGNAQTRRNGILLQHGTVLYKVDVEKMFSVLRVGAEKISDKIIQSVKERVTSVYDQEPVAKEELRNALVKGFTKGKDSFMGSYSKKELARADELVRERYKTDAWNNWR